MLLLVIDYCSRASALNMLSVGGNDEIKNSGEKSRIQVRNDGYTEIDVEQIKATELYAVHKVKMVDFSIVWQLEQDCMTYKIEETILNPHYKKRGDELTNPGFFSVGNQIKYNREQISNYKDKAPKAVFNSIKTSTDNNQFSDTKWNEALNPIIERYSVNGIVSRLNLTKEGIDIRRAEIKAPSQRLEELNSALYSPTNNEWRLVQDKEGIDRYDDSYEEWLKLHKQNKYHSRTSFCEKNGMIVYVDAYWFWFEHGCGEKKAGLWKCFISVEAKDYTKAVNILKLILRTKLNNINRFHVSG